MSSEAVTEGGRGEGDDDDFAAVDDEDAAAAEVEAAHEVREENFAVPDLAGRHPRRHPGPGRRRRRTEDW